MAGGMGWHSPEGAAQAHGDFQSGQTVKARMKNILSKPDASDRTHAAILALQRGVRGLDGPGLNAADDGALP